MRTIRILFSHYNIPDVKTVIKLRNFDNLIPELKKRANVEVFCLTYMPERLDLKSKKQTEIKILDIHDYEDALEVISQIKPDLIIAEPVARLINIAISIAGKHLGIPVCSIIGVVPDRIRSTTEIFDSSLGAFFRSSVPTEINSKKQFMKRGRFFLIRYSFLSRTQAATGMNLIDRVRFFLFYINLMFSKKHEKSIFHPKFAMDMYWIGGRAYFNQLVKLGFKKSLMEITGTPAYDKIFQKLNAFTRAKKEKGKTTVLFAPDALYEHGVWTKNKQDKVVEEIVKEISKHKDKIRLKVKIHPSYSDMNEYSSIIHKIDPGISIYQKEDYLDLLNESDVVVTTSTLSSVATFAVVAKKPIVNYNDLTLEGEKIVERGLAVKCSKPNLLILSIQKAISLNPDLNDRRDEFIRDYLYSSDGKASQRISEKILELIERK